MNFYNEIDPYCCEWLENLIREKLIPDGVVDRRSIVDIRPIELRQYTQCHFFAGLGGWPLALRRAAIPDHRPLWTGSCPCQPFSLAGKRAGFADDRHLWPYWRYLVAVGRPPIVLGEQVASAADWLRLVRGDLEEMGYAVGAMPVEAASAGADHLRDRYWFVAHDEHAREGWRRLQRSGKGSPAAGERAPDQPAGSGFDCVALGDADVARSQGRTSERQRTGERPFGAAGLADTDFFFQGHGQLQRGGQFGGTGGDPETRTVLHSACERRREGRPEHAVRSGRATVAESGGPIDVGNTFFAGTGRDGGSRAGTQTQGDSERSVDGSSGDASVAPGSESIEWVIGADGKARRVKSGIRLLAHGVPARVAKLRAFGNAIDPRPAAAFIEAALGAIDSPPLA